MSDGTAPGLPTKTSLRLSTTACVLGLVGICLSILHSLWPCRMGMDGKGLRRLTRGVRP